MAKTDEVGARARAEVTKLAQLFKKAQSANDTHASELARQAMKSLGAAEAQQAVFVHDKMVLESFLKL